MQITGNLLTLKSLQNQKQITKKNKIKTNHNFIAKQKSLLPTCSQDKQ